MRNAIVNILALILRSDAGEVLEKKDKEDRRFTRAVPRMGVAE